MKNLLFAFMVSLIGSHFQVCEVEMALNFLRVKRVRRMGPKRPYGCIVGR